MPERVLVLHLTKHNETDPTTLFTPTHLPSAHLAAAQTQRQTASTEAIVILTLESVTLGLTTPFPKKTTGLPNNGE